MTTPMRRHAGVRLVNKRGGMIGSRVLMRHSFATARPISTTPTTRRAMVFGSDQEVSEKWNPMRNATTPETIRNNPMKSNSSTYDLKDRVGVVLRLRNRTRSNIARPPVGRFFLLDVSQETVAQLATHNVEDPPPWHLHAQPLVKIPVGGHLDGPYLERSQCKSRKTMDPYLQGHRLLTVQSLMRCLVKVSIRERSEGWHK